MLTPWGDSTTLRERQLQPARGTDAIYVETNQRERLYAATVAAVADKGYLDTTVADLTEISGVSSRAFYNQFEGKEDCFIATLERILAIAGECRDTALEQGSKPGRPPADLVAIAQLVASQPAAAQLAIVESDAAGERAAKMVRTALRPLEKSVGEALGPDSQGKALPAQMTSALVGSLREIAATRLRRGTHAEVPDLVSECWALISSYEPPPEPLRLSVRPPRTSAESLEASDHADRAIRTFAVLVEEQGYQETTVDDVARKAGMSARTLYSNFAGKEDLMGAAIESAGAQTVAAVLPAFSRHTDWPDGVRAGFGAMLGFLASRPALGRLATVDAYAAGRSTVERGGSGAASLTGAARKQHRRLAVELAARLRGDRWGDLARPEGNGPDRRDRGAAWACPVPDLHDPDAVHRGGCRLRGRQRRRRRPLAAGRGDREGEGADADQDADEHDDLQGAVVDAHPPDERGGGQRGAR